MDKTENRCCGCGTHFTSPTKTIKFETQIIPEICVECDEIYCADCHRSRPIKATQDHRIVHHSSGSNERNLTTDEECRVLEPCHRHRKREVRYFCQTCIESVCDECRATDHSGHLTVSVSQIRGHYKKQLQTLSENARVYRSSLSETMQGIKRKKNEITIKNKDEIQNVKNHAERLKMEIDLLRDKAIDELDRDHKVKAKVLEDFEKCLTETYTQVKATADTADYVINKSSDAQLPVLSVHLTNEFEAFTRQTKSLSFETLAFEFTEGKETMDRFFTRKGLRSRHEMNFPPRFNRFNITRKLSFRIPKNPFTICPVSTEQAWIIFDITQNLHKYNCRGCVETVIKTRKPGVDDACFMADGSMLFTLYNTNFICILKPGATTTNTFSKLDRRVRGICYGSMNDEVIVTSNYGKSICFLDNKGIVTKEIKDHVGHHQFSDLDRLTTTPSGMICVADRPESKVGAVLFLSPGGELISVFNGEPSFDKFQPSGVCSDKNGLVFISDSENSCVHVTNTETWISKIFLTEKDGLEEPLGISVDNNGFLWIGNLKGKINIFEYKDT